MEAVAQEGGEEVGVVEEGEGGGGGGDCW